MLYKQSQLWKVAGNLSLPVKDHATIYLFIPQNASANQIKTHIFELQASDTISSQEQNYSALCGWRSVIFVNSEAALLG